MREAIRCLDAFLNKPEVQAYPVERAQALATQSGFLNLLQQVEAARRAAQAGLNLARLCGDRRIEIDNLIALANSAESVGKKEFGQRALALARDLNDPRREAYALVTLGWEHSNYGQARANLEKAIKIVSRSGRYQ